jgi:integrase
MIAVATLRVHRAAQQAERASADEWDDSWNPVIATRNGRPVNHANAQRSWKPHAQAREGRAPGHPPHAPQLGNHARGERRAPARVAQQLAGHADGRMTAQVYTL